MPKDVTMDFSQAWKLLSPAVAETVYIKTMEQADGGEVKLVMD